MAIFGIALAYTIGGCTESSIDDDTSGGITIVQPTGAPVTAFTFPIEVQLTAGSFAPTSVTATLNDSPLVLSGGPETFTATVNPGPPLRDDNVLVVRATRLSGEMATSQVDFQYAPPKARAFRIENADDVIHGPLGHSRVGDYLMTNSVARFAIQDVGKRDLWSVGAFGGNIIDAELLAYPGRDNFLELQPAVNIETVINAQTLQIINDGQDGTAAIIRTCGPDDMLDFVNPSTIIRDAGFPYPPAADDADYDGHRVHGL
jgi:hypothetical protein